MHQRFAAAGDLYALLNLKPTASFAELRAAYRRAALVAHPDKGGTSEAFQAIKLAFEVLSCSASRRLFKGTQLCRLNQRPRASPSTAHTRLFSKRNLRNLATRKSTHSAVRLKRPRQSANVVFSSLKKQQCGGAKATNSSGQAAHSESVVEAIAAVQYALSVVCQLLQSMEVSQRLKSIESLAPPVRASLLSFKQRLNTHGQPRPDACADRSPLTHRKQGYRPLTQRPCAGLSGIRICETTHASKYRAHLVIRGLRLYTNTSEYETAIDYHITFVQMRDAIAAESVLNPCIWTDPDKVMDIMNSVLDANNVAVNPSVIHAFVYTRAKRWLDNHTYITSPVMQLRDAVKLYARLLSAQNQSWEQLRYEWAQLLQHKRIFQAKGLSMEDAEAMIDQARQKGLHHHFKQAVQKVQRAMKHKERAITKASLVAARQERQLASMQMKANASKRKTAMQQRQLWESRRRRVKDITMEDLMRSPLPYL